MNLFEFQQSYHKLMVIYRDVVKIKDIVWHSKLSLNQIDLLLSAIGIVFSRLGLLKKHLEERKSELNEKKDEQTLF